MSDLSSMANALIARLPSPVNGAIGASLRVARAGIPPAGLVDLPVRGRCASCGRSSVFLRCADGKLAGLAQRWPYDPDVVHALRSRENYFCLWCGRNYRMRTLARVAGTWLPGARVYEPAAFGAFSPGARRSAGSYVTSEYRPDAPRSRPGKVRHEDLEALTFDDGSFDLVITSEVLEHVHDPWAAFGEIRRVLRGGGRHVFTVPLLPGSVTTRRDPARPVYHIDPLRPAGIEVVTDFGDDLPDLLGPLGFETTVRRSPKEQPVAWVFESLAT
jgi:SAM-dependent methyltransferase